MPASGRALRNSYDMRWPAARLLDSKHFTDALPRPHYSGETDHALDQQHDQRDHADLHGRGGSNHQLAALESVSYTHLTLPTILRV